MGEVISGRDAPLCAMKKKDVTLVISSHTEQISNKCFQRVPGTTWACGCQLGQLAGGKEAASAWLPARSQEKSAGQFFHMKIQANVVGQPWISNQQAETAEQCKQVSEFCRILADFRGAFGFGIWNKPQRGAIPCW